MSFCWEGKPKASHPSSTPIVKGLVLGNLQEIARSFVSREKNGRSMGISQRIVRAPKENFILNNFGLSSVLC